jgi:hypothetical protein
VLPLTSRGVSLIVATDPADTYAGTAVELRLGDLEWVARCGTAHHAVADELAQKHAVIPFRLFTLFSSDKSAVSALGRRRRDMEKALERVAGKNEWVLKISKPDRGAQGAAGARGAVGAQDSGTSFLQKKAVAKQAAVETARRVGEDAAASYDALAAMAAESTVRDVDSGAGLLLDASFLVAARKVPAFKRALAKTAARLLDEGCRVSLTGPWPPYSFASRG